MANRVSKTNYLAQVKITLAERRVVRAAIKWGTGIRYLNDPTYPITAYPASDHPLLRALKALRAAKNWHRRAVLKLKRRMQSPQRYETPK